MTAINGTADWGIVPYDDSGSQLSYMSEAYRSNHLKSANDQLRYEIVWFKSGVGESVEPSVEGDVVNVIFKVETSVNGSNWTTIGTIKKSRDIANKRYNGGNAPGGHRFTIDVSQLVSDQLSYSLCPINKGTWQSNYYGGMNGGITMQDNVINKDGTSGGSAISLFNVSENGTFRRLRVSAKFEIIGDTANNGALEVSTTDRMFSKKITAVNSVNQFEKDAVYYDVYKMDYFTQYKFLTRCPNSSGISYNEDFRKPVRIDEQSEFLQFYIRRADYPSINYGSDAAADKLAGMAMKIVTYDDSGAIENKFYLTDFQDNLIQVNDNPKQTVADEQHQMFVQNISPYYINNTAALKEPQATINRSTTNIANNWDAYTGSKITADTVRYTAIIVKVGLYSPYVVKQITDVYHYTIDRESENIPYGFVRFHWLNSLGAIDSYTAKRDVVEGLTISRDVVDRKSGDRTWYQANKNYNGFVDPNSSYISDTMRGGDIYKGGREVTNVNADRVQSVYTEPLNKSVATWLEEIMLSPNVWIEKDTDATKMGNSRNPYLRPSTKGYIPVIITNSDIETVNQENGLVRFNIEYTLAHKVQTQRN